MSPTSPAADRGTTISFCLFARKVPFLRTLFVRSTDSCRYCNICLSAGYECGKIEKGLRGHLSAPRAHNLLRGDLKMERRSGVVCVDLINLERWKGARTQKSTGRKLLFFTSSSTYIAVVDR